MALPADLTDKEAMALMLGCTADDVRRARELYQKNKEKGIVPLVGGEPHVDFPSALRPCMVTTYRVKTERGPGSETGFAVSGPDAMVLALLAAPHRIGRPEYRAGTRPGTLLDL